MTWATPERRLRLGWELFLDSFLALYAELVVIRWLASTVGERNEVRGERIGHWLIGRFIWVIHGSGGRFRCEIMEGLRVQLPHSELDTCRVPLIGVHGGRTSARAWGWRDDLRGSLTEGGES